jgi:hypothetical protein
MKYTRYLCIGPGGRKCTCCFPGPGGKKFEYRRAKLRERRESSKDVKNILCETD